MKHKKCEFTEVFFSEDDPCNVSVGIYIESVADIKTSEMVVALFDLILLKIVKFQSFEVDLYLRLSWKEPDLAHNLSEFVVISDQTASPTSTHLKTNKFCARF